MRVRAGRATIGTHERDLGVGVGRRRHERRFHQPRFDSGSGGPCELAQHRRIVGVRDHLGHRPDRLEADRQEAGSPERAMAAARCALVESLSRHSPWSPSAASRHCSAAPIRPRSSRPWKSRQRDLPVCPLRVREDLAKAPRLKSSMYGPTLPKCHTAPPYPSLVYRPE